MNNSGEASVDNGVHKSFIIGSISLAISFVFIIILAGYSIIILSANSLEGMRGQTKTDAQGTHDITLLQPEKVTQLINRAERNGKVLALFCDKSSGQGLDQVSPAVRHVLENGVDTIQIGCILQRALIDCSEPVYNGKRLPDYFGVAVEHLGGVIFANGKNPTTISLKDVRDKNMLIQKIETTGTYNTVNASSLVNQDIKSDVPIVIIMYNKKFLDNKAMSVISQAQKAERKLRLILMSTKQYRVSHDMPANSTALVARCYNRDMNAFSDMIMSPTGNTAESEMKAISLRLQDFLSSCRVQDIKLIPQSSSVTILKVDSSYSENVQTENFEEPTELNFEM